MQFTTASDRILANDILDCLFGDSMATLKLFFFFPYPVILNLFLAPPRTGWGGILSACALWVGICLLSITKTESTERSTK